MKVTFDPAKNASNVEMRGLSFTLVEQLDWTSAMVDEDTRKNYGERRFRVLGFVGERLYAVVFTPRGGQAARYQPAQRQFKRGQAPCKNIQTLS